MFVVANADLQYVTAPAARPAAAEAMSRKTFSGRRSSFFWGWTGLPRSCRPHTLFSATLPRQLRSHRAEQPLPDGRASTCTLPPGSNRARRPSQGHDHRRRRAHGHMTYDGDDPTASPARRTPGPPSTSAPAAVLARLPRAVGPRRRGRPITVEATPRPHVARASQPHARGDPRFGAHP